MSSSASDKLKSLDVIGQLEEELEEEPLDYAKWQKLIKLVVSKDKESQVEQVFKKYLAIFKYDGKQWCNLIEYQLNRSQFDKVEKLFLMCSQTCKTVELFRLYVSYVRRVNDVITGGENARGIVIRAFDVSIAEVGMDLNSGDLWNDYLDFLKSWTPGTVWEKQQKTDLIRKVYKKFFSIPTKNIETVWAQYSRWENETNATTAGRFISENSADYMNSRSWNTEWNNITGRRLIREIIPGDINNEVVQHQLSLWMSWLEFEKGNQLEIKDDKILSQRVEYVYQQCTMSLPFVPEVWFKYSNYLFRLNEDATSSKCIDIIRDGLVLSPRSLLLTFQLGELLENNIGDSSNNNNNNKEKETIISGNETEDSFNEIKNVYTDLVQRLNQKLDRLNQSIDTIKGTRSTLETNNNIGSLDDSETPQQQTVSQYSQSQTQELDKLETQAQDIIKSKTLVYIKLMLASKRIQELNKWRMIFKEARQDTTVGHELYVQSALLEHYSGNKRTAQKVFELGLRLFGTNGDFLLQNLKYLISHCDVDNIRNLVQTSDTNILKEISLLNEERDKPSLNEYEKGKITRKIELLKTQLRKIFKCYIDYAFSYLSLDLAKTLISKYETLFPEDDAIDLFTNRYLLGLRDLIKEMDLGVRERENDEYEDDDDDKRPKKKQRSNKGSNGGNTNNIMSNVNLGGHQGFSSNGNGSTTYDDHIDDVEQYNPIGKNITNLLRILPNASYFGSKNDYTFDSTKLVELFSNLPDRD
ncbi:mRNA 3'-end-processing protein rna14 [Scheffersomyces spartinae]|uniref:mRNA 3'-end-processing protein RNA14 n=1 Tax=Scheffersomyces spartinae TaxID=45513 RepID=A0A9P7VCI4_9ASCO|nr:mRNA 3'-end-processing protein rna14 [Scheffersomyces spartinae]KAG7195456.1 mRNA 3'-end-processing protein rna14 [Scheffersomyces spartinae]